MGDGSLVNLEKTPGMSQTAVVYDGVDNSADWLTRLVVDHHGWVILSAFPTAFPTGRGVNVTRQREML